jgi:hypothetical protein
MQVNSGGRITLRTAADLAATLTIGLLSPIYSQIDPMHVGEAGRASSIAQQYGQRLNETAKNLKPDALDFLIGGYSNHGFVIDRKEASKLFNRVRPANAGEIALVESLGEIGYRPISGSTPKIEFLSDNKHVHDTKGQTDAKPKSTSTPATGKTRKAPAVAGRSSTANGSDTGRLSA